MTTRSLVVIAVLLAGCAGNQAATSAPSVTPQASIATPGSATPPSATVTPTPMPPTPAPTTTCGEAAPTAPFEPDSIVCVVDGPLRARSRPTMSGGSVILAPLLQTGQLLFVIDGPREGSGFSWYMVHTTPGYVEGADGWVATDAEDGTQYLAPASVACPTEPSLEVLASMDSMQRLHCYHAREFTFTDTVVVGVNCGAGGVLKSPEWMAGCLSTLRWGRASDLVLAVPPDLANDVGEVDIDQTFEATITAHMDDPAAMTCAPNEGAEADYDLLIPGTVLACRGMFVATSFKRVTP